MQNITLEYSNINGIVKFQRKYNVKRRILMGDSLKIDIKSYEKILSLEDCQAMCDIISEKMNWPRVDCRAGRENTRRRHGSIYQIRSKHPYMIINRPSEGVILHELAHMCHRVYGGYIKSHGVEFKRTQEMLHEIWNGNMKVCA